MDFPYIALLWNPQDLAQTQNAQCILRSFSRKDWLPTIERPGLVIYTRTPAGRSMRTHMLRNGTGVLLGTVFGRHSNQPLTAGQISNDEHLRTPFAEIITHLSRNYWGGFVALLSDRDSGQWCVHRECSGTIPCYCVFHAIVNRVSTGW